MRGMLIGAYFTDGRCLVAPLEQAAGLLGISEYMIAQALESKYKLRNVVITKAPKNTALRIPKESCRIKIKGV